jgi:hypothetical protein
MLTLWGKGGYGGSPNVEAGKVYQHTTRPCGGVEPKANHLQVTRMKLESTWYPQAPDTSGRYTHRQAGRMWLQIQRATEGHGRGGRREERPLPLRATDREGGKRGGRS